MLVLACALLAPSALVARSAEAQDASRETGSIVGSSYAVDPIFTPPWNRCTQATADCLAMLGYRVLSRDATASRLRLI